MIPPSPPDSTPIAPSDRFNPYGVDPADLIAAEDEAADRVAQLVAEMRASWTAEAACVDHPSSWWFPGPGETNQRALEICGHCPVRIPCLDEAISDPSLDHGIRGGATVRARKVMRRNRRARGES